MNEQLNKRRILYLLKLFYRETDEEHTLTITDIIRKLDMLGMTADRKTIRTDIEILIDYGIDVVAVRGRQNRYYLASREFEVPEVALLAHAITTCQSLSVKKTQELISKLGVLVSIYESKEILEEITINGTVKSSNETIYYSIYEICRCITKRSCISFQYYDYSNKRQKSTKENIPRIVISPYSLVYEENRLYIIGLIGDSETLTAYRVDRMLKVRASPEPYRYKFTHANSKSLYNSIIHSEKYDFQRITLSCNNETIRHIIDKFGEQTIIKPETDTISKSIVLIDVNVGPSFFSWVFQFEGKVRIVAPGCVLEQFHRTCQAFLK